MRSAGRTTGTCSRRMSLKIKSMEIKRPGARLAANYIILSGAEMVSKLLTALAFAFLARVLGPEGYGVLEFTLAILFIFNLLVDSGLSSYGAREIAKDNASAPGLMVSITAARSVLAAITYLILVGVVALIDKPQTVKNFMLLYGLTVFGLPGLAQWVFQGLDRMQVVALASILRWTTFSIGVFLFVRDPAHFRLVPLIEGVAIVLAVVFLIGMYLKYFGFARPRLQPSVALAIFRKAFPIGASEIVWAVKVYFATILLGLVVGGQEVGWFSAAHRIVISLHAFVWLYFYNMLPSIARSSQRPVEGYHQMMRVSLQITAWVAVFLGIFGTAFARTGIVALFGPQYMQAVPVFQVLIWLLPLTLLSGHYRYTLIGYDKQSLEFLSSLAGAGVNLVLNLILIPRLGIIGSAWSLVASEAAIWGITYLLVRRTVARVPFLPHLRWPVITGLLLIAILYWLAPVNIWLAGSAAAVLYLSALLLVKPEFILRLRSNY